MRYFSIVGNTPSLSMAELASALNRLEIAWKTAEMSEDAVWIETRSPFDWTTLLSRLGGVMKAGRSLVQGISEEDLSGQIEQWIRTFGAGRFRVGVSVYRAVDTVSDDVVDRVARRVQTMVLAIKKTVRVDDIRFRMVTSRERALSSVIVETNSILERGGELCVFVRADGLYDLGVTEAVQDFKAYRLRDIGRPRRNAKRGMLPPKLAQMMVNCAGVVPGGTILDPFCGSGTVLQEAMLLGYSVVGSDVNEVAVDDTNENLRWLKNLQRIADGDVTVFCADVREISKQLVAHSVDAIVSEPWLGPPQTGRETSRELGQIRGQVSGLIADAFASFDAVLKSGGVVLLVVPVIGDERIGFSVVEKMGWRIDPLLPKDMLRSSDQTDRGTVIYKRPDQHVAREIVRFKRG